MNQTRELSPAVHVMIQSVADIHEIEIIVYNRSTVLRHLVNVIGSCKLLTLFVLSSLFSIFEHFEKYLA